MKKEFKLRVYEETTQKAEKMTLNADDKDCILLCDGKEVRVTIKGLKDGEINLHFMADAIIENLFKH